MTQEREKVIVNLKTDEAMQAFSKLQTLLLRGSSSSYVIFQSVLHKNRNGNGRIRQDLPLYVGNLINAFGDYFMEKEQNLGEITFGTLDQWMTEKGTDEKPISEKLMAFQNAYINFEKVTCPWWKCPYE